MKNDLLVAIYLLAEREVSYSRIVKIGEQSSPGYQVLTMEVALEGHIQLRREGGPYVISPYTPTCILLLGKDKVG
jgi:hypothetical protein